MNRIVLFAGTTEGRKIVEWMQKKEVELLVCTATDYGKELVEELVEELEKDKKLAGKDRNQLIQVCSGRMNAEEMKEFLQKETPDWVIDATHPYAEDVTKNIRKACDTCRIPYLRVTREAEALEASVHFAASVQEAAVYLAGTTGNILIATGSKELAAYTIIPDYEKRCYARVLSAPEAVQEAFRLGFVGAHLMALQGPFSEEMNLAMLTQTKAAYFVTKESGKTGGYPEKVSACHKAGATLVVIGRPPEEEGMLWEDACHWIVGELKLKTIQPISEDVSGNASGEEKTKKKKAGNRKKKLTLIGIGPGAAEYMTEAAKRAMEEADILFGAGRMLEAAKGCRGKKIEAYVPEQIWKAISEEWSSEKMISEVLTAKDPASREAVRAAVLLSGDVSFYSGARKLRQFFEQKEDWEVEVIPGISSVVYLASRLGVELGEAGTGSIHGRSCNVTAKLRKTGKLFLLTEGEESIIDICKELCCFGWGETRVVIGSRLSYKDELILEGTAEQPPTGSREKLSVLYLELPEAYQRTMQTGHGFADSHFVRGKVPMTKQEIRSVSLSSLELTKDAVVYDVGAGTGSVAAEAALLAEDGMVYAVERNQEGCQLIEENRRKFGIWNMKIVEGSAPEALRGLPAPSHVFLGGSGGNLSEILELVWRKNPLARIVVNAVTVETLAEVSGYVRQHSHIQSEFVQIQSARARQAGSYHLMTGMNPVFVITLRQKLSSEEEEQENC